MTGQGNYKKEIRHRKFLLNIGEIYDRREKDREEEKKGGKEMHREGGEKKRERPMNHNLPNCKGI